MSMDLRTDRPSITHRLGVALQFFDAFTGETVRSPVDARIPSLHLRALANVGDATYRFIVPESPFPPPPPADFVVVVEALAGDYVSHEPITVQLPRTPTAPPPPVRRSDYLVRLPLWPTVRLRVPPSTTAVVGSVRAGAPPAPATGYKVVLRLASENPTQLPYARTDENGDFLYRLDRLEASTGSGGNTKTLVVTMFDSTGTPVGSVNPASVTVDLGRVFARHFTVP